MAKNDITAGTRLDSVGDIEPTASVPNQGARTSHTDDDNTAGRKAERREKRINSFLNEFARSDAHRTQLRKAIDEGAELEGGAYFQGQYKKVREA